MELPLGLVLFLYLATTLIVLSTSMTVVGWKALSTMGKVRSEDLTMMELTRGTCILESGLAKGRLMAEVVAKEHSTVAMSVEGTIGIGKRDNIGHIATLYASDVKATPELFYFGFYSKFGDAILANRNRISKKLGYILIARGDNQSTEIRPYDNTTSSIYSYSSDYNETLIASVVDSRLRAPEWPESPVAPYGGQYGYDSRLRIYWPTLVATNISECWRKVYGAGITLITFHKILYNENYEPEGSIQVDYSIQGLSDLLANFTVGKTGKAYSVERDLNVAFGEGRYRQVSYPFQEVHENVSVVITEVSLLDDRLKSFLGFFDEEIGATATRQLHYNSWDYNGTTYATGFVVIGNGSCSDILPPFVVLIITPLNEFTEQEREAVDRFIYTSVGIVGSCVLLSLLLWWGINRACSPILESINNAHELHYEKIVLESSFIKEFDMIGTTLTHLVESLIEHMKYLPDGIAEPTAEEEAIEENEPPMNKENVTIVFTDIENGSSLWSRSSEAMSDAFKKYHSTIRKTAYSNFGYEVKSIDDSLLLAFPKPEDAINFCLECQTALVKVSWASSLTSMNECEPIKDAAGAFIWNGLRVCMGINAGPVVIETSSITGRTDYLGTVVNMAARLLPIVPGGSLLMTRDMYSNLPDKSKLKPYIVINHEGQFVKDFGPRNLCLLIPQELSARSEVLSLHTTKRRESVASSCSGSQSSRSVSVRMTVGQIPSRIDSTVATFAVTHAIPSAGVDMLSSLNVIVTAIEEAAARTNGGVVQILGSESSLCWNCERPTPMHSVYGVRFGAWVVQELQPILSVHVGIATGKTTHGNIGAGKRRFHIALGATKILASQVCSFSEDVGASLLFAATSQYPSAEQDTTIGPISRLIYCIPISKDNLFLDLYQPDVAKLKASDAWSHLQTVNNEKASQDRQDLEIAVREHCSGRSELLMQICADKPDDEILQAVLMYRDSCLSWSQFPPIMHDLRGGLTPLHKSNSSQLRKSSPDFGAPKLSWM